MDDIRASSTDRYRWVSDGVTPNYGTMDGAHPVGRTYGYIGSELRGLIRLLPIQ